MKPKTKPGLYGENGEWLGAPEPFPELDPSGPINICGVIVSENGMRWMTQEEFDGALQSFDRPSMGPGKLVNMDMGGYRLSFTASDFPPHVEGFFMDEAQFDSDPPQYQIAGRFTIEPKP